MKILATAILAIPVAALVQAAPAQACCQSGPQYSTPGERQYIADAHAAGIPGSSVTSFPHDESGRIYMVEAFRWADLSQADSNILSESKGTLCWVLANRPDQANWPRVGLMFGVSPSSAQLYTLFDSLKANRVCRL